MNLKELCRIDFGLSGEACPADLSGWDAPDQDRRWARGRRTDLLLARPRDAGELVLLVTADPFTFPPVLLQQTLRVIVNGKTLRLTRLRERTSLACRITPELLASREDLELAFEHPDVTQPNMISASDDGRGYSVAFVNLALLSVIETPRAARPAAAPEPIDRTALRPAAELNDAELLSRFASLGDNCEFGMAQRHLGANPMDLLRFSGTWMGGLLRGLETGFADIDEINDTEFDLRVAGERREYVLRQRRFEMEAHTTILEGDMPPARLFSRELKKLDLLSRLFLEDMSTARRIFVFKRNDPCSDDLVAPIVERLRRWGPNTLLHVVLSDPLHPPGTVERVRDGLLRGWIDAFSAYDNAGVKPSGVWREICFKAYELWRASADAAGQT